MPLKDPEARKAYRAEYYRKNTERLRAQIDQYREENLEQINARRRELWYIDHDKNMAAERARKEQKHAYYLANKADKEAKRKARFAADPGKYAAMWAKRDAAKKQAVPKWANSSAMTKLYREARTMTDLLGEPYEVDHIVPLQSDIVCGLHWEGNLRIVTQYENRRKSNSHWPDMP
jgi:hypothetical protein